MKNKPIEITLRVLGFLLALCVLFPAASSCDHTDIYPYTFLLDVIKNKQGAVDWFPATIFLLPHFFGILFLLEIPQRKSAVFTFFLSLSCFFWYLYWFTQNFRISLFGLWLSLIFSILLSVLSFLLIKARKNSRSLQDI